MVQGWPLEAVEFFESVVGYVLSMPDAFWIVTALAMLLIYWLTTGPS